MKTLVPLLSCLLATTAAVAAPGQSQSKKTQAKPAPAPAKSSPTQVAGILSGVVDVVWDGCDRYFHDGDYYRCIGILRFCVEVDPSFDEAYSSAAWLLWSNKDNKAADSLLAYGTQRAPADKKGSLYYEAGSQFFRTNRLNEALPLLKKAVELGGIPAPSYTTLAHTYTKLGRHKEAADVWRLIVKKFPDFPSGPKNLKAAEERAKQG